MENNKLSITHINILNNIRNGFDVFYPLEDLDIQFLLRNEFIKLAEDNSGEYALTGKGEYVLTGKSWQHLPLEPKIKEAVLAAHQRVVVAKMKLEQERAQSQTQELAQIAIKFKRRAKISDEVINLLSAVFLFDDDKPNYYLPVVLNFSLGDIRFQVAIAKEDYNNDVSVYASSLSGLNYPSQVFYSTGESSCDDYLLNCIHNTLNSAPQVPPKRPEDSVYFTRSEETKKTAIAILLALIVRGKSVQDIEDLGKDAIALSKMMYALMEGS